MPIKCEEVWINMIWLEYMHCFLPIPTILIEATLNLADISIQIFSFLSYGIFCNNCRFKHSAQVILCSVARDDYRRRRIISPVNQLK